MPAQDWLKEFQECRLCAWNCGVDRLRGERGVCGLGLPRIAHATLHPAPPASYTIFMAGCNFRCLFCQNWTISTYPIQNVCRAERADPEQAALVALEHLRSPYASLMGADRIFFSGGSPTPSFPFVEALVRAARKREPHTKVNYDTNGFMAEGTFERMIAMADSVTFDIRAVSDDVHRAMTGAPSGPVLANARRMARHPEKLWEFRVLVVPGFNTSEIPGICSFIAGLSPDLPVCFLAFRPNFYLEELRGATVQRDGGSRADGQGMRVEKRHVERAARHSRQAAAPRHGSHGGFALSTAPQDVWRLPPASELSHKPVPPQQNYVSSPCLPQHNAVSYRGMTQPGSKRLGTWCKEKRKWQRFVCIQTRPWD